MDMWRRMSLRHTIHQMDEVLVSYRSGHPGMIQSILRQERRRLFYELRYYVKMRCDTPRHLRSVLPSAATFVLPRIVAVFAPQWVLPPRHQIAPRTRWF